MAQSFVFHPSYLEAVEDFPAQDQLVYINAICRYALYGEDPNLQFPLSAVFKQAKPSIDQSIKRYQSNVENGKKGGRKPLNTKPLPVESVPDKPSVNPPDKPTENPSVKPSINLNKNSNKNSDKNKTIHPLQKWIDGNCMQVKQLKRQLSYSECENIVKDYKPEDIKAILMQMENYKSLLKNYVSVNLTLRRWLEKNKSEKDGKIPFDAVTYNTPTNM